PRRAGIALATGAAAQLVVDAPRLVALRADDLEAARGHDLVALGFALLLELLDELLVALVLVERRLGRSAVRLVGGLLVTAFCRLRLRGFLGELLLFLGERVLRHRLEVAAEDDVRAAAGHVRGDRDRALAAGLRDDRR